jgi:hypothetical protein
VACGGEEKILHVIKMFGDKEIDKFFWGAGGKKTAYCR